MTSRVPPDDDDPAQMPATPREARRWRRGALLNSLSTVEIVVIFVLGSVVLAIALASGIRKLVPDIAERQFEELASGLRVVYQLLFALILAFVIASVLDKFNDAESTVGAWARSRSSYRRPTC